MTTRWPRAPCTCEVDFSRQGSSRRTVDSADEAAADPGAVVFNTLYTRDVEGVRSFLRIGFGGQTAGIGGGAEGWTLPEYVVGSIIPIAEEQPDTPPHWSVTFAVAVAVADATAAKATEPDGRVIVPTFDAPWSTGTYTIRIAVIGDPQGAPFTASKFVPKNKNLVAQARLAY